MRITRPFVLLALAALLAPRAEASRTSVWGSNPPAAVLATTNSAGLLAPLAPAGSLESIGAGVELVEPLRFDLGDIVLVENPRENGFRIGLADVVEPPALRGPPLLEEDPRQAFELRDPETRIRGFELLPAFRVGASASLSLWGRQACGFSCREVASDSRYDPWGLESGATFGAIDRRERGVSAVPPAYTAQEKAAATQRALGCLAFAGGTTWTALSGGAPGGVLGGFALMSSGGAACFGKESPIGMVVRETSDAAAMSQGVEMTPATVQRQAEINANVEGAVNNVLGSVGMMSPGLASAPMRTDGPETPVIPNRGLVWTTERTGKSTLAKAYEDSASGASSDVATQKRNVPALLYDNPNENGSNMVRFDAVDPTKARTVIDRKWGATTKTDQVDKFRSGPLEALRQNPKYKLQLEVRNQQTATTARRLLRYATGSDTHPQVDIKVVVPPR